MRYIHYGSAKYDPQKFEPISNAPYFNKPNGGLWASPVESKFGWKQWCESEDYKSCTEEDSFCFSLKNEAKVLRIDAVQTAKELPLQVTDMDSPIIHFYDFEQIKAEGVDAVEFIVSACPQLYWEMYGWDCDSVIVLNPDVIIPEVD